MSEQHEASAMIEAIKRVAADAELDLSLSSLGADYWFVSVAGREGTVETLGAVFAVVIAAARKTRLDSFDINT